MNKMYVIVNTDHYMSPGKIAAQVAHAVSRLVQLKTIEADAVIVLRGTGEQLTNLEKYLKNRSFYSHTYIDEGVNEVPPFTATAMAVVPINDEEDQAIFENMELL